jgi:hypothetical protein
MFRFLSLVVDRFGAAALSHRFVFALPYFVSLILHQSSGCSFNGTFFM